MTAVMVHGVGHEFDESAGHEYWSFVETLNRQAQFSGGPALRLIYRHETRQGPLPVEP